MINITHATDTIAMYLSFWKATMAIIPSAAIKAPIMAPHMPSGLRNNRFWFGKSVRKMMKPMNWLMYAENALSIVALKMAPSMLGTT
jgi:hypothetical protein